MNVPGPSYQGDAGDQLGSEDKALSNYRWSEGLINSRTYGVTITCLEQLKSDCNFNKITKYATKYNSSLILREYDAWIKSLKVKAKDANVSLNISRLLKRTLRSVRCSVERAEFAKLEEDIKCYWKLTIAYGRERFKNSPEEYLVPWFASDLKFRNEWSIVHGKTPKLSTEQITGLFQKFISPLNLGRRYGSRKKRIYESFGVRAIKYALGSKFCESSEEAKHRHYQELSSKSAKTGSSNQSGGAGKEDHKVGHKSQVNASSRVASHKAKPLSRQQQKRKKKRERDKEKNRKIYEEKMKNQALVGSTDTLASSKEEIQAKIDLSEAHPILLTAMSDFKEVTTNPEAHHVKFKDISPESVEFKYPEGTGHGNGSNQIGAFVVGLEARFDMNQIISSICNFSDDFSYSSSVFEQHIRAGSGLKKPMRFPDGDSPYFLDLSDPETFAVFQSEFVDAATRLYAQRNYESNK